MFPVLDGVVYLGLVEDITDPLRSGRIKVRVQGVYDGVPLENIPYAQAWGDIAGKCFALPAVGKLVNVMFPLGNFMEPVYLYSELSNVNLQNKLKKLSDAEYANFIALLMDNRTQIYVDDSELVLDYFVTSIRIKKEGINLILRNDSHVINIGADNATQSAVLGDNFMTWLDEFIQTLMNPSSLIGNTGAPILKPQLDQLCAKYKSLRPTKFLSNNVKIVDNGEVGTIDDRTIKTVAATQDKDFKINNQAADSTATNDPAPSSENAAENQEQVQDDKKETKDKIVDTNKKEIQEQEDPKRDKNVVTIVPPDEITTDEAWKGKKVDPNNPEDEEAQFEDVKSGNFGDYTGGELGGSDTGTTMSEEEQDAAWETDSLTSASAAQIAARSGQTYTASDGTPSNSSESGGEVNTVGESVAGLAFSGSKSDWLKKMYPEAVKLWKKHQIPIAVTLTQCAQETSFGRSSSISYNSFFGVKGVYKKSGKSYYFCGNAGRTFEFSASENGYKVRNPEQFLFKVDLRTLDPNDKGTWKDTSGNNLPMAGGKNYPDTVGWNKNTWGKLADKDKKIWFWRILSAFKAYPSIEDGFNDYAGVITNKRYNEAFNYKNDPQKFLFTVCDKGYATASAKQYSGHVVEIRKLMAEAGLSETP